MPTPPNGGPPKGGPSREDLERLTHIGLFITDLRLWRGEAPYSPDNTLRAARAWEVAIEEIPLYELQRRDPNSLCEAMKAKGHFSGPHLLLLWSERMREIHQRQNQLQVAAHDAHASERAVDRAGLGYRRLLEAGVRLGFDVQAHRDALQNAILDQMAEADDFGDDPFDSGTFDSPEENFEETEDAHVS